MQKAAQKIITITFWMLALLDIAGIAAAEPTLHFVAKPLLIPVLLLLLVIKSSSVPGKYLLITALSFSWMGDLFLLFEYRSKIFFILGLASFLTTHIFYIVHFLRIRSAGISLLKKQPILLALVPAYGIILVWQLYPYLNDLKIPVMVYAAVICTMLLCSLHIFLKVNSKAARYYVAGAAAFVISDSLLAIDKFYVQHPADQTFAYAGVFIMLTYCAAQYFIVRGYIEQDNL